MSCLHHERLIIAQVVPGGGCTCDCLLRSPSDGAEQQANIPPPLDFRLLFFVVILAAPVPFRDTAIVAASVCGAIQSPYSIAVCRNHTTPRELQDTRPVSYTLTARCARTRTWSSTCSCKRMPSTISSMLVFATASSNSSICTG